MMLQDVIWFGEAQCDLYFSSKLLISGGSMK